MPDYRTKATVHLPTDATHFHVEVDELYIEDEDRTFVTIQIGPVVFFVPDTNAAVFLSDQIRVRAIAASGKSEP